MHIDEEMNKSSYVTKNRDFKIWLVHLLLLKLFRLHSVNTSIQILLTFWIISSAWKQLEQSSINFLKHSWNWCNILNSTMTEKFNFNSIQGMKILFVCVSSVFFLSRGHYVSSLTNYERSKRHEPCCRVIKSKDFAIQLPQNYHQTVLQNCCITIY